MFLQILKIEKQKRKEVNTMQNISNFNSIAPVNVNDKRVINAKTDINQLAPFKYEWAWEFFLKANNNHWTPNEINMSNDLADYTTRLTPAEKHMYENVLAYLTTADIFSITANPILRIAKISAVVKYAKTFSYKCFSAGVSLVV